MAGFHGVIVLKPSQIASPIASRARECAPARAAKAEDRRRLTRAATVQRAHAPQSDGKILVGGDFWEVNDHERKYLARLYSGGQAVAELVAYVWAAVEIGWDSEVNARYQIQWTEEADRHTWHDLNNPVPGTGALMTVVDITRTAPRRFYRVLKLP